MAVKMSKQVVVLSDNEGVARTVELALMQEFNVTKIVSHSPNPSHKPCVFDSCDLLILALSSFASEPIVALAQTSLANQIGRVPMLIISEKPFEPDPLTKIAYMEFPFTLEQLCESVKQLLGGEFPGARSAAQENTLALETDDQ